MSDNDTLEVDWADLLARMREAALHREADRVEWHVEDDVVRAMQENGDPQRAVEEG